MQNHEDSGGSSDVGELEVLEAAVAAQERLRDSVPDAVIDATVAALRDQIDAVRQRGQPKRRRLATVLFADVSGSTELGETIDAEELSDRFDALWRAIDSIIRAHGGEIDKHIGDAVMALWGVDDSSENDAERAIRAGLSMLEALDEFRASDTLPGSTMRIGINTGPVVFGAIAGTSEATAMGDTVNVAARLESAAPDGSVLIGQDTYQHVRGVFSVSLREPLTVKGKRQPLRTYTVDGVRPRAFRLRGRPIAGVETPMVARETELATLQRALVRVEQTGRPEFVTIDGDVGIGKSRLLFEFEDWLRARDGEVRRFSGRGDVERRSDAYGVLRDLVFDRFEITEDEPVPIARGRFEAGVAQLTDVDLGADIDVISQLVGLADGPGPAETEGAAAVARLLMSSSTCLPVVVLLEDVHWADPASARLLGMLPDHIDEGRILVVATSRPADQEARPIFASTTRITLGPLTDRQVEALLDELLDRVDEIPPDLVERVTAAAGGNPFYVEEFVRMLIDEGAVRADDDAWTLDTARLERTRIPTTLRGVLQARLDRLPNGEFVLLQRASIVGPTFWASSLPRPEGVTGEEVGPWLASLARKGLVQREPTSDFAGDDEYRFAHALLYEVAYESVLLADRPALHAHVADWMAQRADGAAATIAGHYRSADRRDDAARWFAIAARRARSRGAAEEGIESATAAIDCGLPDRGLADCLEDLIECLVIRAHYEEALGLTDDLEAVALRLDDPAIVALTHTVRSHLLIRLGRTRDALAEAEAAVSAASVLPPDSAAVIDALTEWGWVLVRLGRADEAAGHARDALARLGSVPDSALWNRVTNLAGVASMIAGRYADAEQHLDAALGRSRLRGARRSEAGILINLSEIARLRGDTERAIGLGREALDVVRSIGDIDQEALVMSNLGGALVEGGDAVSALSLLRSAITAHDQSGASEHSSETHRFLAEALIELGDLVGARVETQAALQLALTNENPDHLGHAWITAGRICAASMTTWTVGDRQLDAEALYRRAADLFADAELHRERALALRRVADVVGPDERVRLLAEANATMSELDLPLLVVPINGTAG